MVERAIASPSVFDRELRPLARSIATMRLGRRGIDADRSTAAAKAAMGEELWRWLRDDEADPARAWSRPAATARLDLLLDRLEAM